MPELGWTWHSHTTAHHATYTAQTYTDTGAPISKGANTHTIATGSTLGAGWGGTGSDGVYFSTLGDWCSGSGVGLGGVGCMVGCSVAVPCPAQLWHALRNAVMALS